MPWRDGEILYDRTARARFHALPVARAHHALDRVLDAHLAVEAAGQVAVDLYDGAFLYDFAAHELHLIDLDEYRPGPFVLTEDRLPGSTRFMAPEEWRRGATIDHRTTVHVLGRTARLLLGAARVRTAFVVRPRSSRSWNGPRVRSRVNGSAACGSWWRRGGRCRSPVAQAVVK